MFIRSIRLTYKIKSNTMKQNVIIKIQFKRIGNKKLRAKTSWEKRILRLDLWREVRCHSDY